MEDKKQLWYELNPSRLEMEKIAMSQYFPEFELMTLECGTLRWSGFIISESKQKYNVVVEYLNTDNGDVQPIIIPVLPDVNGLFCGGMVKFRETMTHEMCGSIGLLNLHSDDSDKSKLETAASKLKKAQIWFENFESKKKKVEEEETKYRSAVARKRQELRTRRPNEGLKVRISKNGFNQVEEIVFDLFSKCNAYLELLPAADHPQKKPYDWRGGFYYKLSLDSTIPPYVIIDSFDDLIDRTSMKNLQIIYKSNRNSFSYKLDIRSLRIKSIYIALIFTYFLQKADIFCFPSGGVDSLYQRKLIFSKEALMNELKRVDAKKSISDLACLTTGISDVNIPFGYSGIGAAPCSFTYYYWNDIKGYIRCYVTIIRHKEEEYIDISDIQYDEYEEALISMSECPDFDIEAKNGN